MQVIVRLLVSVSASQREPDGTHSVAELPTGFDGFLRMAPAESRGGFRYDVFLFRVHWPFVLPFYRSPFEFPALRFEQRLASLRSRLSCPCSRFASSLTAKTQGSLSSLKVVCFPSAAPWGE